MKKHVRNILGTLFIILGIISLVGCSSENKGTPSANNSDNKKYEFRIGHVVAENHPYHQGMLKFKEIIEANMNFDVSVNIFANSQLGGEREMAEALQLGTLDIAIVPGVINSFAPELGALDLPYVFSSKEHAYAVLDGEIGQELVKDLPKNNGFRLLSYWENGFRNVTNSRRQVSVASDLAGITIRVPENKVYQAFFEELGCNVVAMSFSELYTALHQKTIDGQENPVALIATNKLYETQPYLAMTEHFYGPAHVVISEIAWNKLPKELQDAVTEAMTEARDYEREVMAESEQGYITMIEDGGTTINEVDKATFIDAAERTYSRFPEYSEIVEKIKSMK